MTRKRRKRRKGHFLEGASTGWAASSSVFPFSVLSFRPCWTTWPPPRAAMKLLPARWKRQIHHAPALPIHASEHGGGIVHTPHPCIICCAPMDPTTPVWLQQPGDVSPSWRTLWGLCKCRLKPQVSISVVGRGQLSRRTGTGTGTQEEISWILSNQPGWFPWMPAAEQT